MKAREIIRKIVESEAIRVCASCEKELGRQGEFQPGVTKTHGYCRRHFTEYMLGSGFTPGEIEALIRHRSPDAFCPDLSQPAS